jgi:hypothetical protein
MRLRREHSLSKREALLVSVARRMILDRQPERAEEVLNELDSEIRCKRDSVRRVIADLINTKFPEEEK